MCLGPSDGTRLATPCSRSRDSSAAAPDPIDDVKALLKQLGDALADILTAPVVAGVRILYALGANRIQIFSWASQWASGWWGPLGAYSRRSLYKRLLDGCADDVCIVYGTTFSQPGARLGRRVYVGASCNIGFALLEDDVLLGSGVHVLSGKRQHHFDRSDLPIREQGGSYESVRIGRGSWLGNACIVMAEVGEGCIVAAGAVVTQPVPDGAIVGGNPAKAIGQRSMGGEEKND